MLKKQVFAKSCGMNYEINAALLQGHIKQSQDLFVIYEIAVGAVGAPWCLEHLRKPDSAFTHRAEGRGWHRHLKYNLRRHSDIRRQKCTLPVPGNPENIIIH